MKTAPPYHLGPDACLRGDGDPPSGGVMDWVGARRLRPSAAALGRTIGAVSLEAGRDVAAFEYDPEFASSGIQLGIVFVGSPSEVVPASLTR